MHCIAWLLNQKALQSGELSEGEAWNRDRSLGQAPVTDQSLVNRFPAEARQIIMASEELFQRLQRLSARMDREMEAESAVQDMFRRLQSSF